MSNLIAVPIHKVKKLLEEYINCLEDQGHSHKDIINICDDFKDFFIFSINNHPIVGFDKTIVKIK